MTRTELNKQGYIENSALCYTCKHSGSLGTECQVIVDDAEIEVFINDDRVVKCNGYDCYKKLSGD